MTIDIDWLKLAESFGRNQKELYIALCSDGTSNVDLEIHSEARCCNIETKFSIANTRTSRFFGFAEKLYKGLLDLSQRVCFTEAGYELFLLSDPDSLPQTVKLLNELPRSAFEGILTTKDTGKKGKKALGEDKNAMNLVFAWLLSVSRNKEIHSKSVYYCEHTQRHMSLRESWNEVQDLGHGIWEMIFLFARRSDKTFGSLAAISLCIEAHLFTFNVKWAKWRYENNLVEGFGNLFKLLCADASRKVHERESGKLRIDTGENLYFRDLGKQIEKRYTITGNRFDLKRAGDVQWYGNEIKRCSAEISDFKGDSKLYITYLDILMALLSDNTRVGEEIPQDSGSMKKQFSAEIAIPGKDNLRYLDFNHIYSYCGNRLPIINGEDFSPAIMSRLMNEVKDGKYFQLLAFIQYIVESMALIVFTNDVVKFDGMQLSGPILFENPPLSTTPQYQSKLMKTFVSMDERVGFTRFWNEIRNMTLDQKNSGDCPLLELIKSTQQFCLDFIDHIASDYDGVTVHFEKDRVMRGMLPHSEHLSRVLLGLESGENKLTDEVITMICTDTENMLMQLALVPCNSAAVTLSLYIEREIRPATVSHRSYFCDLISQTFARSIEKHGQRDYGKNIGCLFRSILHISNTCSEHALPNKNDPRDPVNSPIILKRVAFMSFLPSLKYFSEYFPRENGTDVKRWVCDYHIQLNFSDLRKSFEELDSLFRLFGLCILLPSQYLSPDHRRTISTIQRWRHKENFQDILQEFDADVPKEFGPIIQNLGDRRSNFFSFMYGRITTLMRDLLFTESYKSDAIFNARIREMAASGLFSLVLCRGYMLIPRLKRWVQKSAKLGLMMVEIHGDYILSHIAKTSLVGSA